METSHFEVNRRLDWGFAILNEIGFLEPSLQRRAVGHGEGTVAASEAAGDDIHPRCDDCRNLCCCIHLGRPSMSWIDMHGWGNGKQSNLD